MTDALRATIEEHWRRWTENDVKRQETPNLTLYLLDGSPC